MTHDPTPRLEQANPDVGLSEMPVSSTAYEGVDSVEGALSGYEKFAPYVNAIKADVAVLGDPSLHPNFLADGEVANVYWLETEEGSFVIRLPKGAPGSEAVTRATRNYIDALELAKDKYGAEQITTGCLKEAAVISGRMHGTPGNKLAAEDVATLDDEHLSGALLTAQELQDADIHIDRKDGNFIVNARDGVGFIDLSVDPGYMPQTYEDKVVILAGLIDQGGIRNTIPGTEAEFVTMLHEKRIRNGVLERLKTIYESSRNDTTVGLAIDRMMRINTRVIEHYSNEEWVAARLRLGDFAEQHYLDRELDMV